MGDFGDNLTDQTIPPQLDRRAARRGLFGLLAGLAGALIGTRHGDQRTTAAPHPKAGRGRERRERGERARQRARQRARRRLEGRQPESGIGRKLVKLTLHNDMGKPIRVDAWTVVNGRGTLQWDRQSPMFGGHKIAAGGSHAWTSEDNGYVYTVEFLFIDDHWAVSAANPTALWPEAGFGAGGSMTQIGWPGKFTKAARLDPGEEVSGVADGRFISIRRNDDSDVKEFVAHIKPA